MKKRRYTPIAPKGSRRHPATTGTRVPEIRAQRDELVIREQQRVQTEEEGTVPTPRLGRTPDTPVQEIRNAILECAYKRKEYPSYSRCGVGGSKPFYRILSDWIAEGGDERKAYMAALKAEGFSRAKRESCRPAPEAKSEPVAAKPKREKTEWSKIQSMLSRLDQQVIAGAAQRMEARA